TARRARDVVRFGKYLGTRIGDGHGQATMPQHRQVRQVVPYEANGTRFEGDLSQEVSKRSELIRGALNHELDADLLGPKFYNLGRSPREDRRALACRVPVLERRAIPDVKLLYLSAVVSVGDAAVRKYAVHVEEQQFDPSAALGQRHGAVTLREPFQAALAPGSLSSAGTRPSTSVMSSNPTGCPSGATTGNSLILCRRSNSTASATRPPSDTCKGFEVMPSPMGRSSASSRRCSNRRARSLSVKMPLSRPEASVSITAPVRRPRRRRRANTCRTVSSLDAIRNSSPRR